MARKWVYTGIFVVTIVMAVVYYFFDPSDSVFFPRCIFRSLTGWDCPGCGSQRALHALLHADVAGAWHYNAGLIVGLPLLALLCLAEWQRESLPRLHRAVTSTTFITILLAAIIVWWIGRNII